ncbi:MAG: stage IV sporulation protein A [Clostridia bacterium]|nr:stage IV sporulation protein A [Clostridia bacterium]
MEERSIYRDIAERTGFEIYVGVVGPVRTGKSTIIKKFMEQLVLPNIAPGYDKQRARDAMPQSAGGRTVMTAEPKFIPDEAVGISIDDATEIKVKLIDCVGFLVPDALGPTENGQPRLVHTPWDSEPVPFEQAAEEGTRRVITDHATIGLMVTTDGSICDLPRGGYVEAEERTAKELRDIGKPYAIVLNSAHPNAEQTVTLAQSLEEKYGAPVALVNALELNAEDIRRILGLILEQFPVKEIEISLPGWMAALDDTHPLKARLKEEILACASPLEKMGGVRDAFSPLMNDPSVSAVSLAYADMGCGRARLRVAPTEDLFYSVLGELTGFEIPGDEQLISIMRELSETKKRYAKVKGALEEVERTGYGVVMPAEDELELKEPQIVRQPGGFGLRLQASAPSIHMMKVEVETEIDPIIGSEQQSKDLADSMKEQLSRDPMAIWKTELLGKSLYDMALEGLGAKMENIPPEARVKLAQTLRRILNEGSNGLLCILV